MKKRMFGMAVAFAVLFMALGAGAALFTDDFNRADVGPTTDGSLIGANYINSITTAHPLKDWEISGNKLVFPEPGFVSGGNIVLHNTSVQTLSSTAGSSFSIAADVTVDVNNRWAGVAFNYQDSANYCTLRIGQLSGGTKLVYQFAQVVGGTLTAAAANITDNDNLVLGNTYNVSAAYDQNTDSYTILVKDGATIMNGTTTIAGSAVNAMFVDGYGGLYASGINMSPTYDNLSISSIPEPATLGLIGLVAVGLFGIRRLHY